MMESYMTSRLVGFRTTKTCDDAHHLIGIQPIYYSVDDKVCNGYLTKLSSGMLEEIPTYGETCNEMIAT